MNPTPVAALGHPTTTNAPPDDDRHSATAVRGASVLILLQVASRALTFVANQLLLRYLTAPLLGVSAQLETYYLSVLFFARESLRVAIQRQDSRDTGARHSESGRASTHDAAGSQSVVNIAYLSIFLGLVAAGGLGWVYLRFVDVATASTPHLSTALHIYAAASITELLSEPAFVVLQHRLRFGPRAAAESFATFLRCLVTFASVSWAWHRGLDTGALPFAVGQLAYGSGLLVVYAWYGSGLARSEGFTLLPASIGRTSSALRPSEKHKTSEKRSTKSRGGSSSDDRYVLGYFFKSTVQLASSLIIQSFVKHLLTQGDTFLVSILSDTRSQGIYALANNYGSLLARLVFQPIEESSRNYFSKLLSDHAPSPSEDSKLKDTKMTQIQKARTDLQALLKFYVLLSVVVVSIGPYAAPLLVQLIAGPRWSAGGAGAVLARYCLYIPLLAINGVAEAFVSSVATESQVHVQSLWMGFFSVAFAIAGFVSLRVLNLGASGLVYANGINMFCRILWSGAFISRYFRREGGVAFGWSALTPAKNVAIYVGGTAALWGTLSRAGISVGGVSPHIFRDLVTVGAIAAPFVGVIAYAERQYLLDCLSIVRSRRATPRPQAT